MNTRSNTLNIVTSPSATTAHGNWSAMRRIFFLFLCSFFATTTIHAQEEYEGTPIQAYLDFCLNQREAMVNKSTDQLRECIEECTDDYFQFDEVTIILHDMTDDLQEVSQTHGGKVDTYFTPDFVDRLLMNDTDYRDAELEGPAVMRSTGMANCQYTHKSLAKGETGIYRLRCNRTTRLICVPSPGGLVAVTVSSEVASAPFKLKKTASETTPYTDFIFENEVDGTVLISVKNISNHGVSFVIATD